MVGKYAPVGLDDLSVGNSSSGVVIIIFDLASVNRSHDMMGCIVRKLPHCSVCPWAQQPICPTRFDHPQQPSPPPNSNTQSLSNSAPSLPNSDHV